MAQIILSRCRQKYPHRIENDVKIRNNLFQKIVNYETFSFYCGNLFNTSSFILEYRLQPACLVLMDLVRNTQKRKKML